MEANQPVFLIGYRSVGKSSVAPHLARLFGYDWIDADDRIEERAGKPIADIFAQEGEAAFRALESRVVAELCKRQRIVVALGGGAVLREENRQTLAATRAPVVWLSSSIDSIHARMLQDPSTSQRRPNLTPAGGRQEIETLLAEREPLYRACATLEVDAEGKAPAKVAHEIYHRLCPS
jgi:shikimate kinase